MGFMTVNHSEANGAFETVAPGKYEVIVTKIEPKTSSQGNPMLSIQLTIRDDIEQPHQKQKLFDNLVQTEKAMFKFQQVAKAMQLPDGTPIETMEDFAREMQFKSFRVSVKNEDYQGKPQARITFYDPSESEYSGSVGGSADPFADNGKPIEISDDDLPF